MVSRPLGVKETRRLAANGADTTLDGFLGGRLRLRQPRLGYRAGLDAVLLAAAVEAAPGERVLEAGCGVGAALLAAAVRTPEALFTGVERDAAALALAQANAAANGLAGRVQPLAGEVEAGFAALGLPPFDAAFANPPFFDDPAALRPPHPARRAAWIADAGLEAWTAFLLKAVREGGRITVIHRTERLADLLRLLTPKAGSIRIRAVHPSPDAPAKRVLVRAVKTGRAPLVLLPPLILSTPEAEALAHGEQLGWS